jgi:hypothetical protein
MMDPFSLIPSPQEAPLNAFSETSRYRGLPLLTYHDREGREIVYVTRRWVPPPAAMAEVGRYEVKEGDRIDMIAASQIGDPELYWRIADANAALAPGELTAPSRVGRRLRITMPEGVPGPQAT